MSWLKEILLFQSTLKSHPTDLVDCKTFIKFIEVVWPCLNNLEAKVQQLQQELKKEAKKQETQPDQSNWEKFPVRLCVFEKSHEFCKKMHFGQGRLAGILKADGATMFEGTYHKVKSKTGNSWQYYIEPDSFLSALLTYPFRNPAERAVAEQYKKEKREIQHGSGG